MVQTSCSLYVSIHAPVQGATLQIFLVDAATGFNPRSCTRSDGITVDRYPINVSLHVFANPKNVRLVLLAIIINSLLTTLYLLSENNDRLGFANNS